MEKSAIISDCNKYRYELRRIWNPQKKLVCWVMLNPSTADSRFDDPTIRRIKGFTRLWAYGGIIVVNIYGYRSKDPMELRKVTDPIGPENIKYIMQADKEAAITICAWGNGGTWQAQGNKILKTLKKPMFLSITKQDQPSHPLYLKKNLRPKSWTER